MVQRLYGGSIQAKQQQKTGKLTQIDDDDDDGEVIGNTGMITQR